MSGPTKPQAPGEPDRAPPAQIPLPLPFDPSFARDRLCVTGSNEAPVALVDAWPDWGGPCALIAGPAGSGKTHLARVWGSRSGARLVPVEAIRADVVPALLADSALAVDLGEPPFADEPALFHLINLARETASSVLFTARSHPAGWTLERADLASRLRAMPSAVLDAPDDALLEAILGKLFADRQIAVDPRVITFLIARMERSWDAVLTLTDRLDEVSLARKRPITRHLAQEVLESMDPMPCAATPRPNGWEG
ncbi:MAG: hypothetical protein ACFB6R_18020 [Alphaproteobacteria bacterium]